MESSAQNSSGVHWCRRRVRFNKVPENVLKVPGGFGAEPGRVQRCNRVPEKVTEKVLDLIQRFPNLLPVFRNPVEPDRTLYQGFRDLLALQSQARFNKIRKRF